MAISSTSFEVVRNCHRSTQGVGEFNLDFTSKSVRRFRSATTGRAVNSRTVAANSCEELSLEMETMGLVKMMETPQCCRLSEPRGMPFRACSQKHKSSRATGRAQGRDPGFQTWLVMIRDGFRSLAPQKGLDLLKPLATCASLVKHQGRPPRMRSVFAVASPPGWAPTMEARFDFVITTASERVMPGPPLRGILSPAATSIT